MSQPIFIRARGHLVSRGTGSRGREHTYTVKVFTVVLLLDLVFSGLATAGFLRLTRRSLFADGVAVALLIPYLFKLFVLVSSLLVMMRPLARWQRAAGGQREALAPAAWLATEHLPPRFSLVASVAWAAWYPVASALLSIRGLAAPNSLPVIGLFAGGTWLAALQLFYTAVQTMLTDAKQALSIEACQRNVALPASRTHFRRRLALTTLAVGIVPNLLLTSLALTLLVRSGGTSSGGDVATVLLFLIFGFVWIPFAAWFQATALAAPLSHIATAIRRITDDPMLGHDLPVVPIISHDELGDLASNFNRMSQRLSQTLTALHAQQVDQLSLLDDVEAKRRLFEVILAHTPVGLALVDIPDYRFRFLNPAYQRFAPGRNLLGRAFDEALPEFAAHAAGTFAEVIRTNAAVRFADQPFHLPRADAPGGLLEVFISVEAVPVHRNERIESVLLVVEDTTERVRAQQRADELAAVAHHHASELQSVLDNMVDGVIVCDAVGRVTLANRAGLQTLDIERIDDLDIDLLAAHFSSTGAVEERPLAPQERPMRRALAGETLTEFSLMLRRGQGGLPRELRISASPLHDSRGQIVGAISVFRDVTELIELDRLKDQFIRAAAHELKTPVTIMKLRAQTLLRAGEPALPERRRGLEAIERGADRIGQIVRDLLELSESQLGRLRIAPRRADLVPLVDVAIEHARRLTSRHRIERSGVPSAICEIDPSRIGGVVERLLDNAVKYSPEGGDIAVSVRLQDGGVVVAVTDQGVGLSATQRRRLFECFYRAHAETPNDVGGLGVGLFLARQIVQLHEGEIGFQSEPDSGSTFWFRLQSAAPT